MEVINYLIFSKIKIKLSSRMVSTKLKPFSRMSYDNEPSKWMLNVEPTAMWAHNHSHKYDTILHFYFIFRDIGFQIK